MHFGATSLFMGTLELAFLAMKNLFPLLIRTILAYSNRCFMAAPVMLGLWFVQPIYPQTRFSVTVDRRVESILQQMTVEEKIDLLSGIDEFYSRHSSFRSPPPKDGRRSIGSSQLRSGNSHGRRDCAGSY